VDRVKKIENLKSIGITSIEEKVTDDPIEAIDRL
jgi:hypothetical protein